MTFCEAIVIKLNGMSIGIRYTHGIIEFRANARCIALHIIAIACTLCKAPVLKFKDLSRWRMHTHRIICVRTEKGTGAIRVTIEIIKVAMTFSLAGIAKLKSVIIVGYHTDGIPYIRTNTAGIADHKLSKACAFSPAWIRKSKNAPTRGQYAGRIKLICRALAMIVAGYVIVKAGSFCIACIRELQEGAIFSHTDRVELWRAITGRVTLT